LETKIQPQQQVRLAKTPSIISSTPPLSFKSPHDEWVNCIVELRSEYGSFVTCSYDCTAKRWTISTTTGDNNNSSNDSNTNYYRRGTSLQHVGTYTGHTGPVWCAVEKDDETLITGSTDMTLKEWNTKTCECLNSIATLQIVRCMVITKNRLLVVCGLANGKMEIRRASDLSDLVSTFNTHAGWEVNCICELEDGTFLSGSMDSSIRRWRPDDGTVLQTIYGHTRTVMSLIELKSNLVISASWDTTVQIWKLPSAPAPAPSASSASASKSTAAPKAKCLKTLTLHSDFVNGLTKLSEDTFASTSSDGTIRMWNETGVCIDTIRTKWSGNAITKVGDSWLATVNQSRLEVRQLK